MACFVLGSGGACPRTVLFDVAVQRSGISWTTLAPHGSIFLAPAKERVATLWFAASFLASAFGFTRLRSLRQARQRNGAALMRLAGIDVGGASRRVANGDRVSVVFTGRLEDETKFDWTDDLPRSITLGRGEMMPGFEAAVCGLQVGQKVSVAIPPEQACGAYRENLVKIFPASRLPAGVGIGSELLFKGPDGESVKAKVVEIAANGDAKVDANTDMAGKVCYYEIELISIS